MRRLAVLFVALLVGCGTPAARGVTSVVIKQPPKSHQAVETTHHGCTAHTTPVAGRCLTRAQRRRLRAFLTFLAAARYAAAVEAAAIPACGGDLPSCCTLGRESHGNPWAVEPGHQGAPYGDPGDPYHHASGKWQFMPGTWNRYDGYPYAAAAPATVQNDKAREAFAGGAGASHWYGDGCNPIGPPGG